MMYTSPVLGTTRGKNIDTVAAISIEAGRFVANLKAQNNIFELFFTNANTTKGSQLHDSPEMFHKMQFLSRFKYL